MLPPKVKISATLLAGLLFAGPQNLVAQDDSASPKVSNPVSWLHLWLEVRSRTEATTGLDLEPDHSNWSSLTRVRFDTRIDASSWLKFNVDFQDARAVAGQDRGFEMTNSLDVRHAYAELGKAEATGWLIRAGRQALSFGDERLIGSDDTWCNHGRSYDAVRATLRGSAWSADVFSASVVDILPNRPDRWWTPQNRVSGVYGSWRSAARHLTVEPYVFWTRRMAAAAGADDPTSGSNTWTPGAKVTTELPLFFSATTEMAFQTGWAGNRPVQAWAGYWELAHRLGRTESSPRVVAGYAYASGDRNSRDNRSGTFDDLYPGGFNSCGFLNPFAWRNVRDLSGSAQWSPRPKWTLTTEIHQYWLATTQDGA